MTYKAYIDNIYAKTGRTPEDYRRMAKERNLTKYGAPEVAQGRLRPRARPRQRDHPVHTEPRVGEEEDTRRRERGEVRGTCPRDVGRSSNGQFSPSTNLAQR